MHAWGDKTVDWKGIDEAANYIGNGLRKWRVSVSQVKEKFGTVRVYLHFGWSGIHDLTHPGHAWIRYKRDGLLWKLQYSTLMHWFFQQLNYIVIPIQKLLYRSYYRAAIRKWPHLRREILAGADYSELLGKEFGIHHVRTGEHSYDVYYDWHPTDGKTDGKELTNGNP